MDGLESETRPLMEVHSNCPFMHADALTMLLTHKFHNAKHTHMPCRRPSIAWTYRFENSIAWTGDVGRYVVLTTLQAARKRVVAERGGENTLKPWNLSHALAGDVEKVSAARCT